MTLNNNSQLHFRYLDSMFALDPELGEIVSAMSFEGLSQDFSVAKWASEDKIDSRQYPWGGGRLCSTAAWFNLP